MTRYVTIGSTGNWAFFYLANGYHESTYFSELTNMTVTRASLNDTELSEQEFASIQLRDPAGEPATITVSEDGRFVRLRGFISESLVGEFQDVLSNYPNLVGVSLNSGGGTGSAALAIGNAIWERRLSTFVPEDARCRGGCSVVFFSGYDRVVEGWLAVSPLLDPDIDGAELFDGVWDLLLHKADNDLKIVALYQTLHWNQSVDIDRELATAPPISRDLPGDALSH
ncbi:hypothetical protein [Ruegeria sp. Ofav3-42]|uniref:hypothetical protein n=1 Tax=Ruegeria sp. Ofav3-42 TaxID=2917759 RepID=UPI001EF4B42C|nr:hypothetical protein [Ruegeria sp. Ofav3-42]MCG7518089.1 hypothetical protein [Ruegeria sp. Ofav3-42]